MSRPIRSSGCLRRIVCGRFRWLSAAGIAVITLAAVAEAQPLPTRPGDLLALHPDCLIERLATSRPDPISNRGKEAALRMLPTHGEVTDLALRAVEKVRSLSRVLRAADRQSIYDIKVVDAPRAAAGNHLRAVLVISKPALDLLSPAELQAIVAHELAHEYIWREHEEASGRRDTVRLRELELVCDAIA